MRMHERRKLVYAPHPEEEDEALRTLEYKELGRVLMVDNVVNWYMESTSSHLFPLVRAVLYQRFLSVRVKALRKKRK